MEMATVKRTVQFTMEISLETDEELKPEELSEAIVQFGLQRLNKHGRFPFHIYNSIFLPSELPKVCAK